VVAIIVANGVLLIEAVSFLDENKCYFFPKPFDIVRICASLVVVA
jgi:hypothetical protein